MGEGPSWTSELQTIRFSKIVPVAQVLASMVVLQGDFFPLDSRACFVARPNGMSVSRTERKEGGWWVVFLGDIMVQA